MDVRKTWKGSLRQVNDNDVALIISVKPGQKREGLTIAADGNIVLRINAPAQEGRANERVVGYLAELLGRPKRDVVVVRGELSRHKEIRIKNSTVDELIKMIERLVAEQGDIKT